MQQHHDLRQPLILLPTITSLAERPPAASGDGAALAPPRPRSIVEHMKQRGGETWRALSVDTYRHAYDAGLPLSGFLERLDPSDDGDPMGAFERVCLAAGIHSTADPARGILASEFSAFFQSPQHKLLFPEWATLQWRKVSHPDWADRRPVHIQAIQQKILAGTATRADLLTAQDAGVNTILSQIFTRPGFVAKRLIPPIPLDSIVAFTQAIRGGDWRGLYIVDTPGNDDAMRLKRVVEGTEIPLTTMVTAEHSGQLPKFGRGIRWTYEAMRRVPIDRIAFMLQRIALQAEVDKVGIATGVLINGDGNSATAPTTLTLGGLDAGATPPQWTLRSWYNLKFDFQAAYTMDTILLPKTDLLNLALVPIGTVGNTPLAFAGGQFGELRPIQDLLANGVRYGLSSDVAANHAVAFDSSGALERMTEIGADISEVERFASNQTQILFLTEVEGYSIIDPNSTRYINLSA